MTSEAEASLLGEENRGIKPALLDRVLTPARQKLLLTYQASPFDNLGLKEGNTGGTAIVYPSKSGLIPAEQQDLSSRLGRPVSSDILVKVLRYNLPTSAKALRGDYVMSSRPGIYHFSVATSGLHYDLETGFPAMLIERATGLNIVNPEDLAKLTSEDIDRICYQVFMVAQAFHDYGASPKDCFKEFYYQNEAHPPRIVHFDNAPSTNLERDGRARLTQTIEDEYEVLKNLRTYLLNDRRIEDRGFGTQINDIVRKAKEEGYVWKSFAEMAEWIDKAYKGKFSQEYEAITGRKPVSAETVVKFSDRDFARAQGSGILSEDMRDYANEVRALLKRGKRSQANSVQVSPAVESLLSSEDMKDVQPAGRALVRVAEEKLREILEQLRLTGQPITVDRVYEEVERRQLREIYEGILVPVGICNRIIGRMEERGLISPSRSKVAVPVRPTTEPSLPTSSTAIKSKFIKESLPAKPSGRSDQSLLLPE